VASFCRQGAAPWHSRGFSFAFLSSFAVAGSSSTLGNFAAFSTSTIFAATLLAGASAPGRLLAIATPSECGSESGSGGRGRPRASGHYAASAPGRLLRSRAAGARNPRGTERLSCARHRRFACLTTLCPWSKKLVEHGVAQTGLRFTGGQRRFELAELVLQLGFRSRCARPASASVGGFLGSAGFASATLTGFGSAGFASATLASAGFGSAGFGSAGLASATFGSAGFGSTGLASATFGSAGFGSAGLASATFGSAGFGSTGFASAAAARPCERSDPVRRPRAIRSLPRPQAGARPFDYRRCARLPSPHACDRRRWSRHRAVFAGAVSCAGWVIAGRSVVLSTNSYVGEFSDRVSAGCSVARPEDAVGGGGVAVRDRRRLALTGGGVPFEGARITVGS